MNLRTRILVFGGVLGAFLGVGAAYLYLRSTPIEIDGEGNEQLPEVQPMDAIKVSLGVLSAVRGIVGLSQRGS
ncbi:MAG: hypothetical protein JW900_10785 [Anaerolineae bacterium]|nr:hypothetical protein [Anaerolineae bacterium]